MPGPLHPCPPASRMHTLFYTPPPPHTHTTHTHHLLLCSAVVNMESEFLNLGLDIIGLGVFNYDFGSITTQSPVIQAVYGVLKGE